MTPTAVEKVFAKRRYIDPQTWERKTKTEEFPYSAPKSRDEAISVLMGGAKPGTDPVLEVLQTSCKRISLKDLRKQIQVPDGAISLKAFQFVAGPISQSLLAKDSTLKRAAARRQVEKLIASSEALQAAVRAMALAIPDSDEEDEEEEEEQDS